MKKRFSAYFGNRWEKQRMFFSSSIVKKIQEIKIYCKLVFIYFVLRLSPIPDKRLKLSLENKVMNKKENLLNYICS